MLLQHKHFATSTHDYHLFCDFWRGRVGMRRFVATFVSQQGHNTTGVDVVRALLF